MGQAVKIGITANANIKARTIAIAKQRTVLTKFSRRFRDEFKSEVQQRYDLGITGS